MTNQNTLQVTWHKYGTYKPKGKMNKLTLKEKVFITLSLTMIFIGLIIIVVSTINNPQVNGGF